MKRLSGIFVLYITAILLNSCSIERELARDFIDKSKNLPIILLSSDKVIFTNEKLKKIGGIDNLTTSQQDSIWVVNTIFLDSIDDKKLTSIIFNRIKSELESYKLKVYTIDNINDFDKLSQEKLFLNLAQFEIVEDIYTHRDEEYFFDSILFYQDVDLNLLNFNLWLELSSNKDNEDRLLFKDYYISDKLNSKFVLNDISYNVTYRYKITSLKLNDIYNFSGTIAENLADCIFNYLMNKYIKENLSSNTENIKQFFFDKRTRFIYQNSDLLFQELKK